MTLEPRFTFDRVAALYAHARAGYPDAVFDNLTALAPPGAKMLEVGCGTGKATLGFARRGLDIVALDPGPAMIAEARATVADFPNVRFVEGIFEAWTPDQTGFDMIAAAQSWHWIPPELGVAKAAALLKPGGTLAIFGNVWSPISAGLRAAIDAVYVRDAPELRESPLEPWYLADGPFPKMIRKSGLFTQPTHRAFEWRRSLSLDGYVDMLRTLSNHQGLEPGRLNALLGAVGGVLRAAGETVDLQYATHVHVAARR